MDDTAGRVLGGGVVNRCGLYRFRGSGDEDSRSSAFCFLTIMAATYGRDHLGRAANLYPLECYQYDSCRFHTRLLTIYTFLEQHIFGSVPLASNLLK